MIGVLKRKLVKNANELLGMERGIVTYINPFSYLKLRKKIDLQTFDHLTSDGVVVKKLSGIFLKKKVQRLSPDFSSYFNGLFKQISAAKSSIYFVGTMPSLIELSIDSS